MKPTILTPETKFLREWSPEDFVKAKKAVKKYFGGKTFRNHRGEQEFCPDYWEGLNNTLGLPYTSTGIFACMSLSCNTNLYYNDTHHFSYVVISEAGEVVLIAEDSEENEIYIHIK